MILLLNWVHVLRLFTLYFELTCYQGIGLLFGYLMKRLAILYWLPSTIDLKAKSVVVNRSPYGIPHAQQEQWNEETQTLLKQGVVTVDQNLSLIHRSL